MRQAEFTAGRDVDHEFKFGQLKFELPLGKPSGKTKETVESIGLEVQVEI